MTSFERDVPPPEPLGASGRMFYGSTLGPIIAMIVLLLMVPPLLRPLLSENPQPTRDELAFLIGGFAAAGAAFSMLVSALLMAFLGKRDARRAESAPDVR